MNPLRAIHHHFVMNRRVERLAALIAPFLTDRGHVLDLGAGDGSIARAVMTLRPDIAVTALEVKARSEVVLPELIYDGWTIPFEDGAFDCVMLVDVVHHAPDPARLLAEAKRVTRERVILKDHLGSSLGARLTLSFMDWVSNAKYGISMPYTYWSRQEWGEMLAEASLEVESWCGELQLYPFPASALFDGSLQFMANLIVSSPR